MSMHLIRSDAEEDVDELIALYRRLAKIDPPVLRSLASDLKRLSDESTASAAVHACPGAQARARFDAHRSTAAQAALASLATES